jgi:hypothetical protein
MFVICATALLLRMPKLNLVVALTLYDLFWGRFNG